MVKVLIAASEAVPFAKTGGLADVCGSLPRELRKLGHDAALIMPAYREVHQSGLPLEDTGQRLAIPVGSQAVAGRILSTRLDNGTPVYLIAQDDYFDRPAIYGEEGGDYRDNCERFVFFCRAVLSSLHLLQLEVELIHCNDWQTALIPVLVDAEYRASPGYESLATLLTIHNLAYQGRFCHWDMLLTGLDWKYFNWKQLEFYGELNLLKGGIVFADSLNTVSPRYASEIQRPPLGCGLEGVFFQRRDHLVGILNGVDYRVWNPALDPHLPRTYDARNWQDGKAACKIELQARLGLEPDSGSPLLAVVGRLAEQKGIDLLLEVMQSWVGTERAQWVVLGTGQPHIEQQLLQLADAHPHQVAACLEFSEELAHQIEASADLLLMPSRYEPCGLSQLYALKYGTLPLVHATGGPYDTVTTCSDETLAAGTATGFAFSDYQSSTLENVLRQALRIYRDRPEAWQQMVTTGMQQDWSWRRGAQRYAELYQQTIARVKQTHST